MATLAEAATPAPTPTPPLTSGDAFLKAEGKAIKGQVASAYLDRTEPDAPGTRREPRSRLADVGAFLVKQLIERSNIMSREKSLQ